MRTKKNAKTKDQAGNRDNKKQNRRDNAAGNQTRRPSTGQGHSGSSTEHSET
jgi:hypothetical protein